MLQPLSFGELKENLKKDFSRFPVVRLGILGDWATQLFARAIKASGYEIAVNFEVLDADFNQIERQVMDVGSELYGFNPEYIILCPCVEQLWARFSKLDVKSRAEFAARVSSEITGWWESIAKISKAKILQFNFVEMNDGVFGHFGNKVESSFLYQIRKLNLMLCDSARSQKQVFLSDVAVLASEAGLCNAHDPRVYAATKMAFALDFLPVLSKALTDIVKVVRGDVKKCLVLDLDNTIWGGVIGDDGMANIEIGELGNGHAFENVQRWARELKKRGILLAVCSKNDEAVAKTPFQEHPEMILRLDDVAVFVANWNNKGDNIKHIQSVLNIGFDSMVFLDDNPFERNLVRNLVPLVTVPELPEDPALYVRTLVGLNLFETASFSEEDLQRTKLYQEESVRVDFQKSFSSIDDYLRSLEMFSMVRPFDAFSVPRIAQLTQRSNQFNLRTIRYTEGDVERIRNSPEFCTLAFHLKDKFGDYGLIGLVILDLRVKGDAFIDTWIMSCRVLKRGMEEFMVNQMVLAAGVAGAQRLAGEYLPTAKNGMVKDLFSRVGFKPLAQKWKLELDQFTPFKTFVEKEKV